MGYYPRRIKHLWEEDRGGYIFLARSLQAASHCLRIIDEEKGIK
jgi:hypothetical protein